MNRELSSPHHHKTQLNTLKQPLKQAINTINLSSTLVSETMVNQKQIESRYKQFYQKNPLFMKMAMNDKENIHQVDINQRVHSFKNTSHKIPIKDKSYNFRQPTHILSDKLASQQQISRNISSQNKQGGGYNIVDLQNQVQSITSIQQPTHKQPPSMRPFLSFRSQSSNSQVRKNRSVINNHEQQQQSFNVYNSEQSKLQNFPFNNLKPYQQPKVRSPENHEIFMHNQQSIQQFLQLINGNVIKKGSISQYTQNLSNLTTTQTKLPDISLDQLTNKDQQSKQRIIEQSNLGKMVVPINNEQKQRNFANKNLLYQRQLQKPPLSRATMRQNALTERNTTAEISLEYLQIIKQLPIMEPNVTKNIEKLNQSSPIILSNVSKNRINSRYFQDISGFTEQDSYRNLFHNEKIQKIEKVDQESGIGDNNSRQFSLRNLLSQRALLSNRDKEVYFVDREIKLLENQNEQLGMDLKSPGNQSIVLDGGCKYLSDFDDNDNEL